MYLSVLIQEVDEQDSYAALEVESIWLWFGYYYKSFRSEG